LRRTLAALALLLAAAPALAQPADTPAAPADSAAGPLLRLTLIDGTVLVGTVVREDSAAVVVRTVGGADLTVPAAQVARRRPYEGTVEGGRLVRYDPNRTRLLFAPTARALGRGQGYVADYYLVLPFVAYGVTDRVNIAGGTVLVPFLAGRVLYAAPKVTFVSQPTVDVAAGAFLGYANINDLFGGDCLPEEEGGCGADVDGSAFAGIAYAVGTFGGPRRAVTVGAGVPFAEGEVGAGVLLMLGGELQLSNSVKLLTENYVPLTAHGVEDALVSGGIRFFGERLAADFALVTVASAFTPDELTAFPFFPFVSFAYSFGR
jgi:hypothetical protein